MKIKIKDAVLDGAFPPVQIGHLTLNSSFTFIKSILVQNLEPRNYFGSDQELQAALPQKPKLQALPNTAGTPQNIVILILESFAAEYTGIYNDYPGYTPFLDSLAQHGLVFQEHYANGRRSIEALPAIFAGIPSLMDEPFITSAYQSNTIRGLGSELQKLGYSTSFFHGATNGSMGFSNFSRMAGIEHYYGLDEYPNRNRDYDGSWGIYDEPYLQYFANTLKGKKQPFMATIFTLSSHPPYSIPELLRSNFPKGTLPIHASIGYTDYALRKFFATASQMPWYKNTLFILTADHTQQTDQEAYHNLPGQFRVPLVLYHPGAQLPEAALSQVSHHCDIPATVMHYAGKPVEGWPFSRSLFGKPEAGSALLYADNMFMKISAPYLATLSDDDQVQIYDYKADPKLTTSLPLPHPAETLGDQLKAQVQLYYNGLINNSLFRVAD